MRSVLPVVLLAAACNTGFEPQYRVKDLRILGVKAEVVDSAPDADVSPGQTVRLSALVANPVGRAGLTVRWYACAPDGTDAVPPCVDAEFLRDPDRFASARGVLPLPEGVPSGPDEYAMTVSLSMLPAEDVAEAMDALTALALEQPTYRCRLYVEIPLVVVAEAEGRREVALKRVRLMPHEDDVAGTPLEGGYLRNRNPVVEAVLRNPSDEDRCEGTTAVDAGTFPPERTILCGRVAEPGSFNVCDPSGNPTLIPESASWQWFATGGEFPEFDGVGNAVADAVEFERPDGPFTLWVIVRDGRGGECWAVYRDL